jgi:hypothetical protein
MGNVGRSGRHGGVRSGGLACLMKRKRVNLTKRQPTYVILSLEGTVKE